MLEGASAELSGFRFSLMKCLFHQYACYMLLPDGLDPYFEFPLVCISEATGTPILQRTSPTTTHEPSTNLKPQPQNPESLKGLHISGSHELGNQ